MTVTACPRLSRESVTQEAYPALSECFIRGRFQRDEKHGDSHAAAPHAQVITPIGYPNAIEGIRSLSSVYDPKAFL